MIYSESKSIEREKINAKTTINTFSVVGEKADNKLIAKRIIDKKSKKINRNKEKTCFERN